MDAKKVGQKLASLRKSRNLTKKQVSKDTGCSYKSICSYEYGTRIPNDDVKQKLANYFNASVVDIFFDNE